MPHDCVKRPQFDADAFDDRMPPPPPIVPPRASWGLTEAELMEGYAQDSARPA